MKSAIATAFTQTEEITLRAIGSATPGSEIGQSHSLPLHEALCLPFIKKLFGKTAQ